LLGEADVELVLAAPARRALITDWLPERVPAAVINFLITVLVVQPHGVGTRLR